MIHGKSLERQRGITLLGFLILAAFIGLFALAGIKLVPVYLEYAKIQSTLTQVRDEQEGQRPSIEEIRNAIQRRFDIEDVRNMTARDQPSKMT